MALQRGPNASPPSEDQLSTAYSLLLLSEYTHTLDSLPVDLSRNFADLRELDAVLSASMHSITKRVTTLTKMIEDGAASKEDRLWLLTEIAEEAGRLKLGGEDKIRVACQAADNLKGHGNHIRSLAENMPGFDSSVLQRKTSYPHVSAQSFMPVNTAEHGRRRRNNMGSLLTVANNADPSPVKRKRGVREDDIDISSIKSPRKERVEPAGRGRTNNRAKKTNERAPSPADSVHSSSYRQPSQNKTNAGTSRATNSGAGNKRSRGTTANNRNQTPVTNDFDGAYDPRDAYQQNGSRRDGYNAGSSSQIPGYQNGANGVPHQQIMQAYEISHIQNWNPTTGQPLEGPGMPVQRKTNQSHAAAAAPPAPMIVDDGVVVNGDVEADGEDNQRYCFCDRVSFGDMIACDDENCEREWFHLVCVGLSTPPSGSWFCDDCKAKRNPKRTARGGKRRAGGRAGAKAA